MKNLLLICLLLAGFSLNAQIKTPAASPKAKVSQEVGLTTIDIEYSRPSMKGRTIFATDGLVPYDKMWRTGANQATTVSFSTDVNVGGQDLKAGTYAVVSVPNATSWNVNFYTKEGNYWSSYIEKVPTAVVSAKPMKLGMSVETFTIGVNNITDTSASLDICWDNTVVSLPMTMDAGETIMSNIDKVLSGPSKGDYYTAATYYHNSGADLNKALEWINIATSGDDPKFWQVRRKALILADMGKKKDAIEAAKMSLELAKTAGNEDYIRMNEKSIKEWMM